MMMQGGTETDWNARSKPSAATERTVLRKSEPLDGTWVVLITPRPRTSISDRVARGSDLEVCRSQPYL
jgi:hypothetical protein